jgi:hypothetical protein
LTPLLLLLLLALALLPLPLPPPMLLLDISPLIGGGKPLRLLVASRESSRNLTELEINWEHKKLKHKDRRLDRAIVTG